MSYTGRSAVARRLRPAVSLLLAAVAAAGWSSVAAADTAVANVPVTSAKLYSYQEPWLAVDPHNPQRMAIAYREGAQRAACSLALSADGGATWHTQDLLGPQGRLAWPGDATLCYEAVAAYGPDGTLYYAAQATISFANPYSRVFITSTRDGVAFHTPVNVDPTQSQAAGDVGGGDWYPRLAVAPGSGRLYVRWTHYTSRNATGAAMVSASNNGGDTFSAPVTASPAPDLSTDTSVVDSFGTALAVGGDGTVYTSWLDISKRQAGCSLARTGPTSTCSLPVPLEVATSVDGGRTFQPPVVVDPAVDMGCPGRNPASTSLASCDNLHFDRGPEAFSLLAGPTRGTAALAWWGGDPERLARISFAISRDGGHSWTAPKTVGTIPGQANDEQQRPALSAAPDGRIDMAYYDDTYGGDQDVYLIRSADAGRTWSSPELVSSASSNINVGPVSEDGVHPGFGEWLGVASADSSVHVAWTDTRRGTVDSAKQDIYFAAVPVGGGTPLWVPVVAGLAGAIVIVGIALLALGLRARSRARAAAATQPTAGRV